MYDYSFDRIHEPDRQTHTQTDRQTPHDGIGRAYTHSITRQKLCRLRQHVDILAKCCLSNITFTSSCSSSSSSSSSRQLLLRHVTSVGVDIDECASNNGGCSSLAVCSNAPGGFTCTCRDGFIGDGYNCSGKSTDR